MPGNLLSSERLMDYLPLSVKTGRVPMGVVVLDLSTRPKKSIAPGGPARTSGVAECRLRPRGPTCLMSRFLLARKRRRLVGPILIISSP